jgi:hypothetical protein
MDKQQARHIIETLRAGVPSREVSSVLTEGQGALLSRSRDDLARVARGESAALIVRGQYGEGKSHLLSAIENVARAEGFAVSSVILSKETPFNRINKVYDAIAHAISANNLRRSGFEDILLTLHPGAEATEDIDRYTEGYLHPKIYYVFRNYFKEGDALKRAQLYDDLAGASLTMADLRAIHRGNFHEAMKIPRRFLIQQDTLDYFRFSGFLLRRAGYKGWVILMDEVELLSKLGIGSRAQAYINLAALLGLNKEQPPLSGVYLVLALASPFVQEALLAGGRNDLAKVPEWLSDPRRNRTGEVPLATAAMQSIVQDSIPLEPLTAENIEAILERLEEYHNLAYGWNGKMDRAFVRAKALAQASNPTRTTIRAGLEYLDLFYQYGKPPDIEVRAPDTDSLKEDIRFEGTETTEGNTDM